MDNEIWKDIEGYPDYQVSNLGRVKSLSRKHKVLKGFVIPEKKNEVSKQTKEIAKDESIGGKSYH